jgi:hypothetical protein
MRAEMVKVLENPLAPMAEFARQNMEQWAKMQASVLSAFSPTKPAPPPSDESEQSTKK